MNTTASEGPDGASLVHRQTTGMSMSASADAHKKNGPDSLYPKVERAGSRIGKSGLVVHRERRAQMLGDLALGLCRESVQLRCTA